jgi:hypothetical protein
VSKFILDSWIKILSAKLILLSSFGIFHKWSNPFFVWTIGMSDYARWARWQSSFRKLNQPPYCFVSLIVIKLSLHMNHRFVIVGFGMHDCVVALWASTILFSSSF